MAYEFNFQDVLAQWPLFAEGAWVTLRLTLMATALGFVLGTLCAIGRTSGPPWLRNLVGAYVEIIRNTPILVQMLIFYFIIAAILDIPRLWAGILCLALYEGAFAAEIMRGAIIAVKKGQREAGLSLGFPTVYLYRDIILPQALPLMLPPLGGVLVNLVKHSAVVSVIAVFDLTTQARTVVSDTFMAFEIWLTAAALYLVITMTLTVFVSWLERRYRIH